MKMKMSRFFEFLTIVSMLCACSDVVALDDTPELQQENVRSGTERLISGLAQIGPFAMGSSVTIQELDGETFLQTGKSLKTHVINDQGDFLFYDTGLDSLYALIEVNGYYLDGNTGKMSGSMITLNALTDLTNRDRVNVNVLTHLETERVLNLVRKQGMSFDDAKKQAEYEIFSSFGFLSSLESPENMDIFSQKNGGALLSISVLLREGKSVDEFSELLALAAHSFAENGSWHGSEVAQMADWAYFMENEYLKKSRDFSFLDYVYGQCFLCDIEKNLNSLKRVNTTVPPFVKYLYDFWTNEYGLGTCDETNYGEVHENWSEHSQFYKVRFECDKNENRWVGMSVRQKPDSNGYNVFDMANGAVYKALRIGNVTWMAENLRYYYPNSENTEDLYLYNIALTGCPAGTRLPRYDEVEDLLQQYGGAGKNAADSLLSKNGFAATPGAGIWISTKVVDTEERLVLWVDSTGAHIKENGAGNLNNKTAYVRCVFDSEVTEEKKKDERIQHGAEDYIKDTRDGEVYRFTEINGKYWMAEDLRYREGVANDSMCNDNACLYSWFEAVSSDTVVGVCPDGWRLPSFNEWYELILWLDGNANLIGEDPFRCAFYFRHKLCDYRDWGNGDYVDYVDFRGTNNLYGFSAKPVGQYILVNDSLIYNNSGVGYWTNSDSSRVVVGGYWTTSGEWVKDLVISAGEAVQIFEGRAAFVLAEKQNRNSVRCVKADK